MDSNLTVILLALFSVAFAAPHLPLHSPASSYSGQHVVLSVPVLRTQYHTQDGLGQYAYGYSNGDGHYKAESKFLDGTVIGHYGYDLPGSKHLYVSYNAKDESPKVVDTVIVQPVASVVAGETKAATYGDAPKDRTNYVDVYKQAVIVSGPYPFIPSAQQTNYATDDTKAQEERVQSRPLNQYGSESEISNDENQSYQYNVQENTKASSQSRYNADVSETAEESSSYQSSQADTVSSYAAGNIDSYNVPVSTSGPAQSTPASVSGNAYASAGVASSAIADASGSISSSSYSGDLPSSGVYAPIPIEDPSEVPARVPVSSYQSYQQSSAQASAQAMNEQEDQSSYSSYSQNENSDSGYGIQQRPVPLAPEIQQDVAQEDENSYRQQDTASVSVHQSVPASENAYHLTAPIPPRSRIETIKQSSYSEAKSQQQTITSSNDGAQKPSIILKAVSPAVAIASVPSAHAVASAAGSQAVAGSPSVPIVAVQPETPKTRVAVSVSQYNQPVSVSHVAVPVVPVPVAAIPAVPVVAVARPAQVVTHKEESSSFSNQSSSQFQQHEKVSSVSVAHQGAGPLFVAPNTVITKHVSSQKQESSASHSSSVNVIETSSVIPPVLVPSSPAPVGVHQVVVPVHTSVNIPVHVVTGSPVTGPPATASPPPPPPPPPRPNSAYYADQVVQQNPIYPANDEQENIAEDYRPARNKY